LTIGLILWGYLTSSIVEGSNAFISSEGYIKQIGLPIYIYVFRYFVSITVTMLINLPVFFLIALIYPVKFRLGVLWGLGGVLMLTAVGFLMIAIFSHLNARFRDTGHMASIGLQVLFFVTPVIWPPEMIRSRQLNWIVEFNPFFHLIEIVRHPLLHSEPAEMMNYLVVFMLIGALVLVAWFLTRKYNHAIAYLL
jgi:ABC-type polysaccharide/polyol phosphate export permease